MTVLEYVNKYLPERLDVNPVFGDVAAMIFNLELAGDERFGNDKFDSLRERAELGIPYQVTDIEERKRVLNVLELILCRHRQDKHGEDYTDRIEELNKTTMTAEEADMLAGTEDWWNA